MSDASTSSSGGVGFTGLLTVAFIVLKLTEVITWSWVWVLSPLWIGFAVFLVIAGFMLIAALIAALVSKR